MLRQPLAETKTRRRLRAQRSLQSQKRNQDGGICTLVGVMEHRFQTLGALQWILSFLILGKVSWDGNGRPWAPATSDVHGAFLGERHRYKVAADLIAWESPGMGDIFLTWPWGEICQQGCVRLAVPTSTLAQDLGVSETSQGGEYFWAWSYSEGSREMGCEPIGARSKKLYLLPYPEGKGEPQEGLGTRVTWSNLGAAGCNPGIYSVGVSGEIDDREQLLPNQIWLCLWEHSKAHILFFF